ncbi:MAG TPA: hypothetical protein VLB46_20755 [Pyrinomonadaceae bacterium]|nr:hypothetical protein [Pyrinomonadaceae bacterium]
MSSASQALEVLARVSPIIDTLGPLSFAEFQAYRSPGTVLWCNFDLLRELGFDVPQSNQLTPELSQQLLSAFSLRAVNGDDVNCHELLTLYADKYGGEGVSPALGAGRAGFLTHGNLYVKGLGFTPLFRHNDTEDFVHSHGGVHLEDCLSEAVFGEVTHNLFTRGSNRIVAIIDQGKHVTEPSGRQRHIALAVRAGAQLRPGHLLAKRARGSCAPLEMLISITRATGQLVTAAGVPDVSATMLRVIDDHAETAAESFRWRMIHGALSPSNMDISGAMLDLPTQSTQPRTAPIFKLDYVQSVFGTEHKERGFHLAEMYRRVLRATDAATRERFNAKWINVSNVMDEAYEKHLQVRLLAAAGLKTELARQIHNEHRRVGESFAKVILDLAALKNRGSACVARKVVEDVSVVDVFNLLGKVPRESLSRESVLRHLKPVYKGNRYHIAKRRQQVELLADEFVRVYGELMDLCAAYAGDYYDSIEAMKASIAARAAFENEPIDALYCHSLYQRLNDAIADYKASGKREHISEVIDATVARSLRSVDGLLAQGDWRMLEDGGIEIERRTIRGVTYSVRAWDDEAQTRRVCVNDVEFQVSEDIGRLEGGYVFAIPDRQELRQSLDRIYKMFQDEQDKPCQS